MAKVTKEALMLYAREDDETMGDLLVTLADSAEAYLTEAGVVYERVDPGAYELAVKALALGSFDNPTGGSISPGLSSLIQQLKFVSAVEQT